MVVVVVELRTDWGGVDPVVVLCAHHELSVMVEGELELLDLLDELVKRVDA